MKELKKIFEFSTLNELLELNMGINFEKNNTLFKSIPKNYQWNINFKENRLTIENVDYTIQQVLGTYSLSAKSWVWGWANEQSPFPNELINKTLQLVKLGKDKNILELKEGHFEIAEAFTDSIGMICSGMFEADSYVCINYGQGIVVLTVKDNKVPKIDFNDTSGIEGLFKRLVSQYIVENPKDVLMNYLLDRGLKLVSKDETLVAYHNEELIFSSSQLYELGNLRRIL